MSSIPSSLTRTSLGLTSASLQGHLHQSNLALLRVQTELSTGLKVNKPSDAPQSVTAISLLRAQLERFTQRQANLNRAEGAINVTDQALADASDLVLQAQTIASSQIGIASSAAERASQAEIIDAMISSMHDIASRQYDNIFLFSGSSSNRNPFEAALGGFRYAGSTTNLASDLGAFLPLQINSNGAEALGALSSRVKGNVDLNPLLTGDTRLSDVHGARDLGISLGVIEITISDGATTSLVKVDLAGSSLVSDVRDRINAAINSQAPGAATLEISGGSLQLVNASATQTVSINEIGTGIVAADLGIRLTAAPGATATGGDLDPKLTDLTRLADLGATVDWASGLVISNGSSGPRTIDLSGAQTIQDLANLIHGENIGVRVSINAAATGLDFINEVSGARLSVGENGGTTATDLGVRTLSGSTLLADFNNGLGVRILPDKPDLRVTLHDGRTFDVTLTGSVTVQDVINRVNAAAAGAGVAATDFSASLTTTGNGLRLADNTAGAGSFGVQSIAANGALAAADLGIAQNVGAAGVITGQDLSTVQVESVFTHLIELRDALRQNDDRRITLAAEKLSEDSDRLATVRASAGVRARRVEELRRRVEDRQVHTTKLLSNLRDTDYAQAISQFGQLQQQLQASLLAAQQVSNLSLMDYLR